MSGWDSYRAVYGVELRAAAREFSDHGWPVVEDSATTLLLLTGRVLDVLEVPSELGQRICGLLRETGSVVAVAATPADSWWFPVSAGAVLPDELVAAGAVLHGAAGAVPAPPSELPDGWVHWRVAPAQCGYRVPPVDTIFQSATDAVRWLADHELHPGAQRPAGVLAVGMRY